MLKKLMLFMIAGLLLLSVSTPVLATDFTEVIPEVSELSVQFKHTLPVPTGATDEELDELIEIASLANWDYNAIENVFEK
jgi:hypothetical protein